MSLDQFRNEQQKKEHYQKEWDKAYDLNRVTEVLIKYVNDESLDQIRTDCFVMKERLSGCVGVKGLFYMIEEEQKKREAEYNNE